jgi:predicted component of type VI protein secretion system
MNTGQATPIMDGEFAVGRADDAYVHLDDASVSRRHAMIINNGGVFFVEDLGSANGTAAHGAYINGRVRVNFGDVIHIGSVPFRIDPEVAGDVDAIPSAGLRTNNRAYMRRDTEKIPTVGESQRVAEVIPQEIPQENLSAPLVSTVHDMDAEDLNAITIKEPEAPKPAPMAAIRATSQGAFVPPARPASTILRQSVPLRRASQKITLQHAPTPTSVAVPNPEPIRAPSQPLPRTEITPN